MEGIRKSAEACIPPKKRSFSIDRRARVLCVDGVKVVVSEAAFDILDALVAANGDVIRKQELISRVWPGSGVQENTLQAHVSALRKALKSPGIIVTLPGLGYRLASSGIFRDCAVPDETSREAREDAPLHNLPPATTALIGRDESVTRITRLFTSHYVVSLTGPGGIGKTRLSLAVAEHLLPRFPGGVWFVELATVPSGEFVASAVATTLGISVESGSISAARIALALGHSSLLLVLDNCEHVLPEVSELSQVLLQSDRNVRILVTSREPMRIDGERVYIVPPLDVPTPDEELASDILSHAAVQLFCARSAQVEPTFELAPASAPDVASICRRLDGIPLALELAAARSATMGIRELAARLDNRFSLLTTGRRTALPRQRTLRATLDWSYDLLSESERTVLARLTPFAGTFSIDAAIQVVGFTPLVQADVIEIISSLVSKSLVEIHDVGPTVRYRLLESMRAYAHEKLMLRDEFSIVSLRHAQHYQCTLSRRRGDSVHACSQPFTDFQLTDVDNLRVALQWAFSNTETANVAVALTASAVSVMLELSLVDECRTWAESALKCVALGTPAERLDILMLNAALATAITFTRGPTPQSEDAWKTASDLAVELQNDDYLARSLWGLWTARVYGGSPRAALDVAERFMKLAEKKGDARLKLMAHRMLGVSYHFLGEQSAASRHLTHVLERYVHSTHASQTVGYLVDQGLVAGAVLSRVQWMQGLVSQAIDRHQHAVAVALDSKHTMSRCYVLVECGIPVNIWIGRLDDAQTLLARLFDDCARHGLTVWEAWGRCFEGVLEIERRNYHSGVERLSAALNDLQQTGFTAHYNIFLGNLAEGLADSGRPDEALSAIDDALESSMAHEDDWSRAELLRIKGRVYLSSSVGYSWEESEALFRESIRYAMQQGALSWALRSAIDLVKAQHTHGKRLDLRLLANIQNRFESGLKISALSVARNLMTNAANVVSGSSQFS